MSNEATRDEVYAAIDGERSYQDSLWRLEPDRTEPNQLTIGEFVLMIEEYAAKARAEWIQEKKPEQSTLHVMRKIGAIAVNCMEQHGAPPRNPTDIAVAAAELAVGDYEAHKKRA